MAAAAVKVWMLSLLLFLPIMFTTTFAGSPIGRLAENSFVTSNNYNIDREDSLMMMSKIEGVPGGVYGPLSPAAAVVTGNQSNSDGFGETLKKWWPWVVLGLLTIISSISCVCYCNFCKGSSSFQCDQLTASALASANTATTLPYLSSGPAPPHSSFFLKTINNTFSVCIDCSS